MDMIHCFKFDQSFDNRTLFEENYEFSRIFLHEPFLQPNVWKQTNDIDIFQEKAPTMFYLF